MVSPTVGASLTNEKLLQQRLRERARDWGENCGGPIELLRVNFARYRVVQANFKSHLRSNFVAITTHSSRRDCCVVL